MVFDMNNCWDVVSIEGGCSSLPFSCSFDVYLSVVGVVEGSDNFFAFVSPVK